MFEIKTAVRIAKIHIKSGAPEKTIAKDAIAVTRPR
jgi:hypothetical protein